MKSGKIFDEIGENFRWNREKGGMKHREEEMINYCPRKKYSPCSFSLILPI